MMIRACCAAVLAAAAAACATVPPADDPLVTRETSADGTEYTVIDRTGSAADCPADAYQVLVGQRVGEIDRDSLPVPHRVYGPDDAITMDVRLNRLNIVFDSQNTVVEVRCG